MKKTWIHRTSWTEKNEEKEGSGGQTPETTLENDRSSLYSLSLSVWQLKNDKSGGDNLSVLNCCPGSHSQETVVLNSCCLSSTPSCQQEKGSDCRSFKSIRFQDAMCHERTKHDVTEKSVLMSLAFQWKKEPQERMNKSRGNNSRHHHHPSSLNHFLRTHLKQAEGNLSLCSWIFHVQ